MCHRKMCTYSDVFRIYNACVHTAASEEKVKEEQKETCIFMCTRGTSTQKAAKTHFFSVHLLMIIIA